MKSEALSANKDLLFLKELESISLWICLYLEMLLSKASFDVNPRFHPTLRVFSNCFLTISMGFPTSTRPNSPRSASSIPATFENSLSWNPV